MISLSKRLEAIAALIPEDGGVADVGTDHGYIPVWLLQNGFQGRIVATDIHSEPLSSAERTAQKCGLYDKIEFFLCDGLTGVDGTGIKTVVVAGMGGETIISVLSACPWAIQGRTLILQPMSKPELLRGWLVENGYSISGETLVRDGVIYVLITASQGFSSPLSAAERLTGRFELISGDPLFPKKLEGHIARSERVISGLSVSAAVDSPLLEQENLILSQLKAMRQRLKGN